MTAFRSLFVMFGVVFILLLAKDINLAAIYLSGIVSGAILIMVIRDKEIEARADEKRKNSDLDHDKIQILSWQMDDLQRRIDNRISSRQAALDELTDIKKKMGIE